LSKEKEYRQDRCCESCGQSGAALVSEEPNDEPYYLCETCMKFSLNRRMTSEEIVTLVEKHWGIEADAITDTCPACHKDRIKIVSIDKKRIFIRCGCGTQEGFQDSFSIRFGR
jgi:hypothetical protein